MAKSRKQLSKKMVVCVEDDFLFGKFLSLMLERDGFKVVSVGTGKDAIYALEDLQPDLVILDLMLPDLHGWQIIQKMREQPTLRDIPIIVVTALSSDADRTFAQDIAGVHAYLTKPVAPDELRRAIATALSDD